MIDINPSGSSAKIYQFPVRPRPNASGRIQQGQLADSRLQHSAQPVFSGAWYHEAAIREADHPNKA